MYFASFDHLSIGSDEPSVTPYREHDTLICKRKLYPTWVCSRRTKQAKFELRILSDSLMAKTIFEVKPDSFVFTKDRALPLDICREMIRRFEAHPEAQYPGRIGQTMNVDASIKRSTDLALSGKSQWQDLDRELLRSLSHALAEFQQSFPYFAGPFKDNGYAIQRTDAGGFYHWHIDGGSHEFALRQLVAVWYLNSLQDQGGETEFQYQDIALTPVAGQLVLFPPFWTHLHRGNTLRSGHKYIATTWVVFA